MGQRWERFLLRLFNDPCTQGFQQGAIMGASSAKCECSGLTRWRSCRDPVSTLARFPGEKDCRSSAWSAPGMARTARSRQDAHRVGKEPGAGLYYRDLTAEVCRMIDTPPSTDIHHLQEGGAGSRVEFILAARIVPVRQIGRSAPAHDKILFSCFKAVVVREDGGAARSNPPGSETSGRLFQEVPWKSDLNEACLCC